MKERDVLSFVNITLKYLIIFILISMIEFTFPGLNVKILSNLYSQVNFNSSHLNLSKLFILLLTIIMGFLFYNEIHFINTRRNKFVGPNGGYKEIIILIVYGIFFFITSGNQIIKGKYDYEGFCTKNDEDILKLHENDGEIGYIIYQYMSDFKRVYSLHFMNNIFNLEEFYTREKFSCIYPGIFERKIYNFLFFVLPFILGLYHEKLLKFVPYVTFMRINSYRKTRWNKAMWLFYFLFLLFVGLNCVLLMYNYWQNSYIKLLVYIFFAITIIGVIVIISFRLKDSKTFCYHKCMLMMISLPFVNIHCIYWTIIAGIMTGILVADLCENGLISMWIDREEIQKVQEDNFINSLNTSNNSGTELGSKTFNHNDMKN